VALAGAAVGAVLGADDAPPPEQAATTRPTMAIGTASLDHRAVFGWFTGSSSSCALGTLRGS
jgi:hypothetical protein